MQALRNWIIQNQAEVVAASIIRARLGDQVEISRNDSRITIGELMEQLNPDAVQAFEQKLRSGGLNAIADAFVSGITLSNAKIREKITGLGQAGIITNAEVKVLLDLGITYGPRWEFVGLESLPTVEEIQAVQATIATEELREQVAQRYQSVREAIDAGKILTWEAARLAMGAEIA
jgi:hypothetical protein